MTDEQWVGTSSLAVGAVRNVGVRTTSAELQEILRRAFARHLVPGDEDVPAAFTVVLDATDSDEDPPAHELYRGTGLVHRSPDPARLVGSLLHELEATRPFLRNDRLRISARLVVSDGFAALAPADLSWHLEAIEGELRAAGVLVSNAPFVDVDLATLEVVVEAPDLAVDADELTTAISGLIDHAGPGAGAPEPGRYPLVGWAVVVAEGDEPGPLRAALAIQRTAPLVVNGRLLGGPVVLDALRRLVTTTPVSSVGWAESADLAGVVRSLLAPAGRPTVPLADPPVVPDEIDPEAVEGSYVPLPRQHISAIEHEGEVVVYDATRGKTHLLNEIGGVIWSCFDGEATLDDLVVDLSEAFAMPEPTVREDVEGLVRTLGHQGLLVGLRPWAPTPATPPEPLPVGTSTEPFAFPDLAGNVVNSESLRNRRVLLVNWSPACGYCDRIADELAALRPGLAIAGVELVLVSTGDAEQNLEKARSLGVDLPILLHGGDNELFAGQGTPVAYLLDEAGAIAEPLRVGASDVPELARLLAGQDGAVVPRP